MKCGVIVNNLPVCPKCSNNNYETLKIQDVDVAKIDGEPHFELTAKCWKCDTRFYYFLDTEMFERKAVDKSSDRYTRTIKESVEMKMEDEE